MENKEFFELTNPQKSIWYTEQFYSETTVNNICVSGTLYGQVDEDILKQAINNVVKQNDSFRIHVILDNNVAKQYISDYKEFNIDVEYVNAESEVIQLEKTEAEYKFDIIDSDLFRFKIAISKNNFACIILTVNHLIADSWSLGLVIQEIIKNYNSIKNNEIFNPDTFSYLDYINSEKEYINSKKYTNDKSFWNQTFSTIPEQATIPCSINGVKNVSYKAKRLGFEIDKDIVSKINNFCRKNNISTFNFFMTIFSIYIGRVSNIDDFVIGTPILNRSNFREKHTTGMFINTVPVRFENVSDGSFKNLASIVASKMMGILRHQKYSYNSVLEDIRKEHGNIPNLYNVLISYQVTKAFDSDLGNYKTDWIFNNYCANDFNIHIYDINDTGSLFIDYDYLIDKYSEDDVICIQNRIVNMVKQILANNDINSCDIDIVTPDEKNTILNVFNNTNVDFPRDKTIVDLFEDQVKKTPDNIAVVFEDKKLTYKQLNEKANQLARYLIKKGVNPHTVIGLRLNKRLEMIIGILAIIKSGCCYLPINMQYPEDRVNFMLSDSNAKLLLGTADSLTDMEFDLPKIDIDLNNNDIYNTDNKNLNLKISPEDLIYIIYTSGSTGKPKGAMLCHRNVVRLFKNDKFLFDFDETDAWVMFHSVAFDFSVWEMYGALLFGGKLVLISDEVAQDPELFLDVMRKEHVTVLNQTPTYFYKLLKVELEREDNNLDVRYIIFGGEALKPNLIKGWYLKYPKTKLINMYGITETTVHVTFKELLESDLESPSSNIGVPIPTLHVIIVDKNLKLLPFGTIGEMCVLGEGVFKGYLNRDDLNKTKLINIPEYSNQLIYRSGDTAIMHKDGHLEYMGRIDTQVKIRGFRVELGEIEEKILKYSNIDTCIVTKKIDEFDRELLCAYYIKNGPLNISALRLLLNEHLPTYMIPQYFIEIDKVPININGKTDFKALPLPTNAQTGVEMVKPRNEIDTCLLEIYEKILHVNNISMSDSFFELGGDSLTAITISEAISKMLHVDVTVKDVLEKNIIMNLSDYISVLSVIAKNSFEILPAEKAEFYPLSSAQKRIYYACKMIGDENIVYNISGKIEFNQHLNSNKVKDIFKKLIDRHVSFRTAFVIDNNEVKQKIVNNVKFDIPVFNSKEDEMQINISNFVKPFNLDTAPLLRVELHYLENGKTILLIDTHHIIMDGTSLENLINDFNNLYNDNKLSEKTINYIDYAVWEQQNLESEKMQSEEKYWINKINNFPIQSLNLPYDYNPKAIKTFAGNKISQKIDDSEFKQLEDIAKSLGVSPYILFISAFIVLLHKYTNQNEIVIGSPIANREYSELQNLIGMFVNNLTITSTVNPNVKFSEFLYGVKEQIFEDINNQEYPYDMLIKKLNIPNNSSLFDVVFTYQNTKNNSIILNNELATLQEIKNNISKFNITLEVQPNQHTINLEYMTDLFKLETMKSFMEHYVFILHQLKDNINVCIKDINIITPKEDKLLDKFNDTFEPINNDTVVSLFEEQVRMNPENIALICNDEKLTYSQLNAKANSLAHYLLQKGIKPNDIVCIMANRSLETIICMLGILKSGAAFLNLDPTYPVDRTKYYISDSNVQYVLVQKELSEKVESIKNCIYIDLDSDFYNYNFENPNVSVEATDLSYMIYTSGSTGMPKGVMLNQVGFANMTKAMTKVLDYLKEGNKHTIVSVTSTPFDIFVYEIIVSLTHGLKVVMANNAEHRNPKLLDALIKKYNVDVMTVTPSLMKINYDNREPNSALALVKNMVFGGEPLPEKFVKDLKALADDITVYNIYGPSEITILSNVQNLNGEKELTVGPPIMNTQIHILDKNMKRVPIGVVGEIYISGIQVGLGYMGKPDMTSAKFLDNPFGPGKIYKSGDIGRWTFDGKVQCLGRIDNQIKLRGLRIELGEIENRILEIEGISSAVVNKIELDGKEVLCGYYVSNVDIEESHIKEILRQNLPPYMIPSYILRLDKMPYTINRKVDRKALPIPQSNHKEESSKVNIATLNSNEDKLIQIWKNILKVDNITIDDNFFDLGGDSVSAITMQLEAVKYDLDFEYADIFNYPTIRQLAKKLPSPEKSFMDNYNYDTINKVLSRNNYENIKKIKKYDVKNVLLIGSTGYLGSHIVDSFMKNESGIIYCLIREKNNQKPLDRLRSILSFYFGNKYINDINSRIKVLTGDITKQNLGLSAEDYNTVKNDVDVIINSGAIVKHYGLKQQFEDINVVGTQNVVDLCKRERKRLLHVSTMSVSGFGEKENNSELLDTNKIEFCENNLFVGQSIKGIYTSTKYRAEVLILEAISKGLDAQILRIGNITNRYSDGVFQRNIENNAFANRIKSFVDIGAFPEYALEHEIELTPVDLCADCIIKILEHSSKCNMFHLYNPNLLSVKLLYDVLTKEFNINLVPLSNRLLSYLITGILQDEKNKKILSGIIYDLDNDKNLIYTSKIKLNADFTNAYLDKIGFNWKKIDEDYIVKYMNYFKKIKFINLDKE